MDKNLEEGTSVEKKSVMKDYKFKSYDMALEWSKQITTLSTGSLILRGTFLKDILNDGFNQEFIIITCWVLLGISILFGVLFISKLNGDMARASDDTVESMNIYEMTSNVLAYSQIVSFLLGLALFIVFLAFNVKVMSMKHKNCPDLSAHIQFTTKNSKLGC